jgi:hypothetical protein
MNTFQLNGDKVESHTATPCLTCDIMWMFHACDPSSPPVCQVFLTIAISFVCVIWCQQECIQIIVEYILAPFPGLILNRVLFLKVLVVVSFVL